MPRLITQQTMIDGSVTGGPVVPIPTHPLIKTAYSPMDVNDVYICNFETSRQFTLSGLSGTTMANAIDGAADHGMIASPRDSMTAVTASVTGSMSGYFMSVGMLLSNRGFTNSFTGTTTASIAAAGVADIGIFALRKRLFDTGLKNGCLTATVTGTNYAGDSIAGDYFDSGSGHFIQKSTGNTIGASLVDDGMFVVTTANMREVATSVTSVKYKTRVLGTSINVFCKCQPDEMNFSTNLTTAVVSTVSSETTSLGEIQQSYDNILTKSPLTANTDRFQFTESMTGNGAGPYITTVGLYNNSNDLMAIAKLAKPLKKPTDLPLTFKVQIDI